MTMVVKEAVPEETEHVEERGDEGTTTMEASTTSYPNTAPLQPLASAERRRGA